MRCRECNYLRMHSVITVSPQGELPHSYSPHVIHSIPVKRLLLECTKEQAHYAPLYPRLIRLLVTHLPHLCLVTDWIEQEEKENSSKLPYSNIAKLSTKMWLGGKIENVEAL